MRRGIDLADALRLLQSKACEAFVTFDARFARTANGLDGFSVCTP